MASQKRRSRLQTGKQRIDESNSLVHSKVANEQHRRLNVFDAVAGRVTLNGLVEDGFEGSTEAVLAPEELLFKSSTAPERMQEDDFYWADRHLDPESLPESDLLKVIHSFTSDYYHLSTSDHGRIDTNSLDGTALLALGILLEETAADVIGATGDMAFIEGQQPQAMPITDDGQGSNRSSSRLMSVGLIEERRISKKARVRRNAARTATSNEDLDR